MQNKNEFLCFFCGGIATRLAYYSKFYPYSNRTTQENPTLCCNVCFESPRIINQINPVRGGIEGVYCFLFTSIAKWDAKQLGYHLSKKGWEINHLSSKNWRKLIWRIHFINISSKKKDNNLVGDSIGVCGEI